MASRVKRYSYRPPKPKTWTVTGWRGMYDSRANVQKPDEAALLINLLPLDPVRGGPAVLSPGLQRLTTPTTTQIDGAVPPQWIGGFTKSDGTYLKVIVAGGEIYTLSGSILTEVVSTANLATASITLNSTGTVHCVEFSDTLVVSDEDHAPFTWDGASGAGGLTKLTNAPSTTRGAPTVYYAKLFFVKTDGRTIVWSEELQPNTGYEASGYSNAWELSQTSAFPLRAILGTNEGLYYFRSQSVGVIRGAVSSTFQNDGVHDSVTQRSGIHLSVVPLLLGEAVWWTSADNHPMAYRPGGQVVDIGHQIPRRFGTAQGYQSPDETIYGSVGEQHIFSNLEFRRILGDRGNGRVHFEGTDTGRRVVLICDAETLVPLAYRVYPTTNLPDASSYWAGIVVDTATSSPGGLAKLYGDEAGYLFTEPIVAGTGTSAIGFDEVHDGAGAAVTGMLVGPMHGHTARGEWQFDQLDVLADAQPTNSLTVGYITSRFHKAGLTPADQIVSDSSVTSTPYERHKAFGLGRDASGRWLRPIILVAGEATANRLPQIHGYTLTGSLVSSTPSTT